MYSRVLPEIIERRAALADPDNGVRKQRLVDLFQEAGCRNERLTEQEVSKKGQPNVICTLPGSTDAIVVVGAHFDTVKGSRGLSDNWSGAALLTSLYQSLANAPRRHTFVFIGFTDEEKGLVGSKHYVKKLAPEEKARLRAMVNIDTLGLSPINVWASRTDQKLTAWLVHAAASQKVELTGVNVEQVGSTDSESFAALKIPRISVSSVTPKTFGILHTSMDDTHVFQQKDYWEAYTTLAVFLTLLDMRLGE